MKLWRQQYTLRTFTVQKMKKGYASQNGYTDSPVMLDVQPDTARQLQVQPEGSRRAVTLYAYGDFAIKTADQKTGVRADLLFYEGQWYECKSSVRHVNTPLAHYKSTFLSVPESTNTSDVAEPQAPAAEAVGGEEEE